MGKKESNYQRLVRKLAAKGADDPKALAAHIGRKKYGQAEMTRRSIQGRKNS